MLDDTPDVGAPEAPATIGLEGTADTSATPDEKLSATIEAPDEETALLDAEIDKQVAEKPADVDDLKYFRTLLRNKEKEARELKNQKPEFSDREKEAIELYEGLTAFDVNQGIPSSKDFAQRLVTKDKDLAVNASWDLATQQLDDSGLTVGHLLLQKMGLDPYRLEELREFSAGKIKGEAYGMVEVPEYVPQEVAAAYKLMSKPMRDNLDYMLESADPGERQAAIESLQDRQAKIEFQQLKAQQEQSTAQRTQQDIAQTVDTQVVTTFNDFTNQFKETPTYKTATVSGNPQLDSGIKSVVSMAILGLSEPDSVMGRQSLQFFTDLGVNVKSDEVQSLVNSVIQNIEASVKADKGGYTNAKNEANSRKDSAMLRAAGVRNRIFSEALTKLAGTMKEVSEANGNILEQNGGMPQVNGSGGSFQNGQPKVNTLDLIKTMIQK